MIRVGLIGGSDPRHRWFLTALRRRRAGVRIIGLADPDPAVRDGFRHQYDLPTWSDHRDLLAEAGPSLVAVTSPDPGPVVIDALRAGTEVLVVPPVCGSVAELDEIATLAGSTGRRVTAVHTHRGHPAARTAKELVESGRLGRPDLVSLIIGGDCVGEQLRRAVGEAVDLFGWLTGATSGAPGPIDDDPDDAAAFGKLILTIDGATADGNPASLEIRRSELAAGARIVQVAGESGAVEWDTSSGLLRASVGASSGSASVSGQEPTTVSCGTFPDPGEWVLNNLLRKPRPVISTEQSLAATRIFLTIDWDAYLDR